jgi:hypothetical protein
MPLRRRPQPQGQKGHRDREHAVGEHDRAIVGVPFDMARERLVAVQDFGLSRHVRSPLRPPPS